MNQRNLEDPRGHHGQRKLSPEAQRLKELFKFE